MKQSNYTSQIPYISFDKALGEVKKAQLQRLKSMLAEPSLEDSIDLTKYAINPK